MDKAVNDLNSQLQKQLDESTKKEKEYLKKISEYQ